MSFSVGRGEEELSEGETEEKVALKNELGLLGVWRESHPLWS